MARSDDDTWEISAESIGATALGTAEWRAKESTSEHPLFTDPYAQLFLDVAHARGLSYTSFSDNATIARLQESDPLLVRQMMAQSGYVASRTKWYDDFFAAAQAANLRQAVILGAGLDARAWRLSWAKDSLVFEIDQPRVLEFKTEILQSHGVEPACRYTAVGIDLRYDWPKALCDNGFDPQQPTAWAAEGLLVYLPADAQHLLFDRVQQLSAARSRIAVDAFGAAFFDPENLARLGAWFGRMREAIQKIGGQLPDTPSMWSDEDRTDVTDWLRDHGWHVESVGIHDLMASYQRGVTEEEATGIPACDFISGRLNADR